MHRSLVWILWHKLNQVKVTVIFITTEFTFINWFLLNLGKCLSMDKFLKYAKFVITYSDTLGIQNIDFTVFNCYRANLTLFFHGTKCGSCPGQNIKSCRPFCLVSMKHNSIFPLLTTKFQTFKSAFLSCFYWFKYLIFLSNNFFSEKMNDK